MGMWDYMNSLAGAGGGPGYGMPTPTTGIPQAPSPLGGLPQLPSLSGSLGDFLRGFGQQRPLAQRTMMSPFSIGGRPSYFDPAQMFAGPAPRLMQAQSMSGRTGGINGGIPDFFGGGRMRPAPYTPNPNVHTVQPGFGGLGSILGSALGSAFGAAPWNWNNGGF